MYQKASTGTGSDDVLLADSGDSFPNSWSPDGRFLLYENVQGTAGDLWVLPLFGDGKPFFFLQTAANEYDGQFSPDGRWIAYVSDESGRPEVYVARFSDSGGMPGEKRQVSTTGGGAPLWRKDAREIFYVTPPPDETLMAAAVTARDAAFDVATVQPLFDVRPNRVGDFYQVSPDGQRFLFNMAPFVEAAQTPITVVVNWTAGLKK